MAKLPDPRRVKVNRSYSVKEAADVLEVDRQTVRRWLSAGLAKVGGRGETLILGRELRPFLQRRRETAKRPCPQGHLFCMKCRAPQRPEPGLIEYRPMTPSGGMLKAICETCMGVMNRRVRKADLPLFGFEKPDADGAGVEPKRMPLPLPE